jgi:hypothetical protein
MNPRKLSRSDLVDLGRAAADAIAGGRVTGLTLQQAADFSAEIADATDALASANTRQVQSRATYLEDNEVARQRKELLLRLLSQFKATMIGLGSPDDQYDAVGLNAPATRSAVIPEAPTDLAVRLTREGIPVLAWSGNNRPGRVIYNIEAMIGGEYRIVGSTRRQSFKLEDHIPGRQHIYRVYAQSARRGRSDPSNETLA